MNTIPPRASEELRLVEDFCNSATLLHDIDELQTVVDANAWLMRNGWEPIESEEQGARLRSEREVIRDFIVNRSDPTACQALNELIREHWSSARIDATGRLTFVPVTHVISPAGAASEALMLYGLDAPGQRLKACASEDCRYVFYDSSRSQTRTWCDMDVCGARHKMKQYRARIDSAAD